MISVKYKDQSGNYIKLSPYFTGVSYKLILDTYGEFSFNYPITDPKAQYLNERTEIQIFEDDELKFSGYIVTIDESPHSPTPSNSYNGVGLMEEFAREITIPNISYSNVLLTDLLNPAYANTIIRPSIWTTDVELNTQTLTYLSSFQKTLKMFEVVKEHTGFHFRYSGDGVTPRKIDFGEFGEDSGVKVRALPKSHFENTDDYLLIPQGGVSIKRDSLTIVNQLYPVGGGGDNGINQLTLRDVNPAIVDSAYPIEVDPEIPNTDATYDPDVYSETKTGSNTVSAYYIKDDTSQSIYGVFKEAVSFKDVYPLSSDTETISDTDRRLGANELYKVARQYLIDNKNPQVTYSITAIGNAPSLKVGDYINLKYRGEIKKINPDSSEGYVYKDIDEDLYVIDYTVDYLDGSDVKNYQINVSNKLKPEQTDGDVIADAINDISVGNKQRAGSVTTYPIYFEDSFDASHPAEFLYWIPPQTVYTDYISLKVKIKKFRAYSQATQGGGAIARTSSSNGAHYHAVNASATGADGTGVTAHQHRVNVSRSPSSKETLESLGYRYLMVQPSAGGTASACQTNNLGLVWTPSSSGDPTNSNNFKADCTIGSHTHPVSGQTTTSQAPHTHTITLPDHTHNINYGIYEDAGAPTSVKIYIDGVDYSPQLGVYSAFGDYPSATNESFDLLVASERLGKLSDFLTPGVHTIEVKCLSGLGKAQLFITNQFYVNAK